MRNDRVCRWMMLVLVLGSLSAQLYSQASAFTYSGGPYCRNAGNVLPTMVNSPGSGMFTEATGNVVFADPVTGEINMALSTAGNWQIKRVVGLDSTIHGIGVLQADDAAFSYIPNAACMGAANFIVPVVLGLGGGVFYSSVSGVLLDPGTGAVDLNNTPPGVYPITYQTSGQCPSMVTDTLTIQSPANAFFDYLLSAYCAYDDTIFPDTITMPNLGSFHVVPAGLIIDSVTGTILTGSSQQGIYTVEYSIGGACPGQWQQTIYITEPYLGPLFIYPDSVHCTSDPVFYPAVLGPTDIFFSSNGATFDSLSLGSIDPGQTQAGTYIVEAVHAGVCQEVWTQTIYIFDIAQVQLMLSGDTLYAPGSGTAYQWYLGGVPINGATNSYYFTNGMQGTYTVSYHQPGDECGTMGTFEYLVAISDQNAWLQHSRFYPNPTEGKLNYELRLHNQGKVHWLLYNSLGIVAAEGEFLGGSQDFQGVIELESLPAGSYRLRLVSNAGAFTTQVVLMH